MHSRRFSAFISYRHADNTQEGRRWAEWLHRGLERYVVPPDLIGTPNLRGDPIRDSLYPIFRDEDELPANADLATGIRAALEVSDHLIVLCSPRSAVSPWVRKEVKEFKELGRSDRILAIIIAGEPNADDPAKAREGILRDEECFCEELRFGAMRDDGTLDWTVRTEPLAADLRPVGTRAEGFVTAEAYREHLTLNSSLTADKIATRTEAYRQQLDHGILKVAAGLLGVPLGQLVDRDAAHRTALAEKEAAKQLQIAQRERLLAAEARRAEQAAQAARQRTLKAARGLAIASGVALVLALLAGWFWRQAGQERQTAVQSQKEEAKQRQMAEQQGTELRQKLRESSMADYNVAVQRIDRDRRWHEGVAYLARSLKWWESNPLASARLYSTLAFYAHEKQTWPRVVLRHDSTVRSAQFSPDGTRIITASRDQTARVWDAASGRPLGGPMRHERGVNSAQFSPDGTRIVTVSDDNTAQVWDAASGKALSGPMHYKGFLDSARFSPDSTRIVTISAYMHSLDYYMTVWDVATGKQLRTPLRCGRRVTNVKFSPDGARFTITAGGLFSDVWVWDTAIGGQVGKPLKHDTGVSDVQFSPDSTRIVTAGDDGTARAWDAASGKAVGETMHHKGGVNCAQFSPDGTRIITASDDKTAQVWDAATGRPLGEPLRYQVAVRRAQFSVDGTRILTVGDDNTAQTWDAATNKPLGEPLRHEHRVYRAQFSADGTYIVTASVDNIVRVWDTASGRQLGEPLRLDSDVSNAQFSPGGMRVVTLDEGHTACVWEVSTGKPPCELLRHEDGVRQSQFSPDGTRIATISDEPTERLWAGSPDKPPREDGGGQGAQNNQAGGYRAHGLYYNYDTVRVWNAVTGRPLGEPVRCNGIIWGVQFSPDGTRIVTMTDEHVMQVAGVHYNISSYHTARVWDAASGKPLGGPMRHEGRVNSARFSPDGTRIVTSSDGGTAQVWDAATGMPLGEPLRHARDVHCAQFSADSTRIVTASDGGTAQVWDTASGKPLGEPLRHEGVVYSAQFSTDGTRIVTASADSTARVWDAASGMPLGEPLRHQDLVHGAQFNADGTLIVTASDDNTARVWDAATGRQLGEPLRHDSAVSSAEFSPDGTAIITHSDRIIRIWSITQMLSPTLPVKDWFLARSHAIAGLRFDADGQMIAISAEERHAVLLEAAPGGDDWSNLARWMAWSANDSSRKLTPVSEFTLRQIAERKRDSRTAEGLASALLYDPTLPLAHVLLAKFEGNPHRADFLRSHGLKLLPDDANLWARAAASLVEQKDFQRALQAAEKTLKLDPNNTEGKKALEAAKQAERGR